TWNTFFARSKPIVVICMWTAPSCDSVATITLRQFVAGSGRRPPHQEPTYAAQQKMCAVPRLLDHLVGAGEQHRWHLNAKCPSRFEVDHQLEFGSRLHRQIGRLLAVENAMDV